MVELCELSQQVWPQNEGTSECHVFILQSRRGKTNPNGEKFFTGAMRHRDPLLCTMGALAQYFFWRWHYKGEAPPQFRNYEDWYRMRVIKGGDPEKDLHYSTHAKFCARAMADVGVIFETITHGMRSAGAQDAEGLGVPESQVS
jgi:Centromere DNA-binding protein complex CBF3 subunit, domain 2